MAMNKSLLWALIVFPYLYLLFNNFKSPKTPPSEHYEPNKALFREDRVLVFVITPTYARPTQMADMTRLAQTLRLVEDVFWIVVEDSPVKTRQIKDLLDRTAIPFVHLLGEGSHKFGARGTSNRLKALHWLRDNYLNTKQSGVFYLADDDNSYDVRVFEEMRSTKRVSMFPVGLIAGYGMSAPIVDSKTGKIIGFHDYWHNRKFAVDMAGFAVNLQYYLKTVPNITMETGVSKKEDSFLKSLKLEPDQMEPKAANCTQILVWHSQTAKADAVKVANLVAVRDYYKTNLLALYRSVIDVPKN